MNFHTRILATVLALLASVPLSAANQSTPRLELAADSGWKFLLGDPKGAESPSFADSSWRSVDLPHDWSIESKPDKNNPGGAGEGYFPGGVGWYRKTFQAPADWKGKRVTIEFDGVYQNATVYLNGNKLGTHPYGYTAFAFDLTPALKVCRDECIGCESRQLGPTEQPLVQRFWHLQARPRSDHKPDACGPMGGLPEDTEFDERDGEDRGEHSGGK